MYIWTLDAAALASLPAIAVHTQMGQQEDLMNEIRRLITDPDMGGPAGPSGPINPLGDLGSFYNPNKDCLATLEACLHYFFTYWGIFLEGVTLDTARCLD